MYSVVAFYQLSKAKDATAKVKNKHCGLRIQKAEKVGVLLTNVFFTCINFI